MKQEIEALKRIARYYASSPLTLLAVYGWILYLLIAN